MNCPGKFGILDTLRSFLGTKIVAQLGLEGSPVLDVPSSAPKQSMPEVHGLVGSPVLESTGTFLSTSTQPILEALFTKPSKDIRLIDIICSYHVCAQSKHACDVINSDLCCMY